MTRAPGELQAHTACQRASLGALKRPVPSSPLSLSEERGAPGQGGCLQQRVFRSGAVLRGVTRQGARHPYTSVRLPQTHRGRPWGSSPLPLLGWLVSGMVTGGELALGVSSGDRR